MTITINPAVLSVVMTIKKHLPLRAILFLTSLGLSIALWRMKGLKTMPSTPDLCHVFQENEKVLSPINRTRAWWEWACMIERELDEGVKHSSCKHAIGGTKESGNYVMCYDRPYKPQRPCLVYSFGINNEFEFDDFMASEGCEVFSFDPSMGVGDHQHAPHVTFKAIGLSSRDSDNYQPNVDVYVQNIARWRVRTLASVRKMLEHEHRTLDILKIDVESYEWGVMREILSSGQLSSVRQLLIEWHIFPNEPFRNHFPDMYKVLQDLQAAGFRLFHLHSFQRHHYIDYFNSQADSSWVNTKFARPEDSRQYGSGR